MTSIGKPSAVVVDASVLIALCAKEAIKYATALSSFDDYTRRGFAFFAPNVIVAEVSYVLCRKAAQNLLTVAEHERAVRAFSDYMSAIEPPPGGEAALVGRAEEIRLGYGCSRASDGLYLALAESLGRSRS